MKKLILTFLLINFLLTSVKGANGDTLFVNPNPCDSVTTIYYTLSQTDSVSLDISSVLGQVTKTFFTKSLLTAGSYSIVYVTDPLPNGVYFVSLKIGSSQKITKIVKSKGVGLIENSLSTPDFIVYPNPTTSILNIEYHGLKSCVIIDTNGKIVLQKQTDINEINLSDLSIGTYFLKMYSDNNQLLATKKIIKSQ
ncbi:T9SS type A sorting domain-containing protein [Aurantibacillus circumpalustris]|uniref:T9SS type A sorting domain-containing protein n=1 Tax=Aurantibacillus circumpalustris TaxID=3036359 RepID=UPI00295AC3BF|nr:T9SS type A sorting domain-containing protein [Aurantibacillus circumpalustris]